MAGAGALSHRLPAPLAVLLFMISRIAFFSTLKSSLPSSILTSALSTMATQSTSTLRSLRFDNRNLRVLPVDPESKTFNRQVKGAIFSYVKPLPVRSPRLVAFSQSCLELLGIDASSGVDEEELALFLSGNELLPGSVTAAHCYCGHQFGSFAGQLGDGAAISLGEVVNAKTGERLELQLKGAGLTPYSRSADGRKVLRSSIREFLCSEAMHFLNIPTTRAAACVTSDSTVQRDPLYDGRAVDERCTLVSRVAPNFFRFGSFEIFKAKSDGSDRAGPSAGDDALKERLLNHMLLFFPDINSDCASSPSAKYVKFYEAVVASTAKLVAKWQAVGWVHGVLNTDNMSLMGVTIDYGPFGFMEAFDLDFVPNGSDSGGRYSYRNQPEMCRWNLQKLAEALRPLLSKGEAARALESYYSIYDAEYDSLMRAKLGLGSIEGDGRDDKVLVQELLVTMHDTAADFTDTFVALTDFAAAGAAADTGALAQRLSSRCATPAAMVNALRRKMKIHRPRMHPQQIEQLWSLLQQNPAQVAEMFEGASVEAITQEIAGEKKTLDLLVRCAQQIKDFELMSERTRAEKNLEVWAAWASRYALRLAAERLGGAVPSSSVAAMRRSNPTFVLRNWVAQDAIQAAEGGDFSRVREVLALCERPFAASATGRYSKPPPPGAESIICTCSS